MQVDYNESQDVLEIEIVGGPHCGEIHQIFPGQQIMTRIGRYHAPVDDRTGEVIIEQSKMAWYKLQWLNGRVVALHEAGPAAVSDDEDDEWEDFEDDDLEDDDGEGWLDDDDLDVDLDDLEDDDDDLEDRLI